MQYMLLIYDDERAMAQMTPEQRGAMMKDYQDFTQGIVASGEFRAGDALQRTTTATSVRLRDGETLLTDGPFAETREALGGYYLVEAADLDRAIAIARQIPAARSGTIEVRPVVVWEPKA